MNQPFDPASPQPESSALVAIEQLLFHWEDATLQSLFDGDPANLQLPSEDRAILPLNFPDIAPKLHQTYLGWKQLRDRQQTPHPTLYRHAQAEITQAAETVAQDGTPIEPAVLFLLEVRIVLATLNSLLLAANDYLQVGYLQETKESIDAALSTLYEFIQAREQLEPSLAAAVASIQQEIANAPEAQQYASYLVTQILRLQGSPLLRAAKFYVVRHQLEKLSETLHLLMPAEGQTAAKPSTCSAQTEALIQRLFFAIADESAYITEVFHKDEVWTIAFSPDGTYLATASADTVKLTEVATNQTAFTIDHHSKIWHLSFSPDGQYLATAAKERTGQAINAVTGKEVGFIRHRGVDWPMEFSPDAKYLAAASGSQTVKLVEIETGNTVVMLVHLGEVAAIQFSPDGRYLATASQEGSARLVEVAKGRDVGRVEHRKAVKMVIFSADGRYWATVSKDNTVKVIEVSTNREVATIEHLEAINAAKFSPNGQYFVTASQDKTAKLVDITTNQLIQKIEHWSAVNTVEFCPKSHYFATASSDRTANLVEVKTGRKIATISHWNEVHTSQFSPNGAYLATAANDGIVKLVKVETGEVLTEVMYEIPFEEMNFAFPNLKSALRHASKLAFSPDSQYLATASKYGTIQLLEVATGQEIISVQHENSAWEVAFSPDGQYLATASADATVKLVNLDRLSQLLKEEGHQGTSPQSETTAMVQTDKPEAFFLGWLRSQSNRCSFYEYMRDRAAQDCQGLSVKYGVPVLETTLLLESVGFLLINAEKHYQRIAPLLATIEDDEIRLISLQYLRQNVSAALSSLHEFIYQRMELDGEYYGQAIERLKQEIEADIDNCDRALIVYQRLQFILKSKETKNRGELQTIKGMLEEIEEVFLQVVPTHLVGRMQTESLIPIRRNIGRTTILSVISQSTIHLSELPTVISNLRRLGLLKRVVILALIGRISAEEVVYLCELLSQEEIDRAVAQAAIEKRREAYSVLIFSPETNIADKATLLNLLNTDLPQNRWF